MNVTDRPLIKQMPSPLLGKLMAGYMAVGCVVGTGMGVYAREPFVLSAALTAISAVGTLLVGAILWTFNARQDGLRVRMIYLMPMIMPAIVGPAQDGLWNRFVWVVSTLRALFALWAMKWVFSQ